MQKKINYLNLPKIWKIDQFHNDTDFRGDLCRPSGNKQKVNVVTKMNHNEPAGSPSKITIHSGVNENNRLLSDLLGI